MDIELVTYLYVAADAEVGSAKLQEHDGDTDEFLAEHLRELRKYAVRGDVPNAEFREERARQLFQMLRFGSDDDFLAAAVEITSRLRSEMDGRSSPGLMVFVRASDEKNEPVVAALKLQVVTAYAGILLAIAGGEENLQTVRNVLDAPGKIQKGVSAPDVRGSSELVVGDKLGQRAAAEYFVRALGIQIDSRPAEAALALVQAVSAHAPDNVNAVLQALPDCESEDVDGVLDELVTAVPELAESKPAVEHALSQSRRPIRNVATNIGWKLKVRTGSVTIAGPASDLDNMMTIQEGVDTGGWIITLRTQDRPQRDYSK